MDVDILPQTQEARQQAQKEKSDRGRHRSTAPERRNVCSSELAELTLQNFSSTPQPSSPKERES
ncbi:hypothetical protein P7K49_014666 [Saguinus oedipus]|uniref:Uncharacterized protein n=1 Tax=Saguinus oedipus TaxID=9490 RepID=A0ABQ9V6Z9_SAGOE|nr:hypothetical protein P7K49_014666 [Saguinus oedipus]